MSVKEKNLPNSTSIGYVRTLDADGKSVKTPFSDFSGEVTDNNFTDPDKAKLDGIEAGAEVNVQADWSQTDNTKDDFIKNKDKIAGDYPYINGGLANNFDTDKGVTDQVPYLFRPSGGDLRSKVGTREYDELVGGTVAWNQLAADANLAVSYPAKCSATKNADHDFTITSIAEMTSRYWWALMFSYSPIEDHVYLFDALITPSFACDSVAFSGFGDTQGAFSISASISANDTYHLQSVLKKGTYSANRIEIYPRSTSASVASGNTWNIKNYQFIDLTLLFGSTIADYIYSLETANAGAGLAWFKKLFPKPYYAYDAGSLKSVKTSKHKMVGFNQWDEEWELGTIYEQSGGNGNANDRIRSKNYIPILPNTTYYVKGSAKTFYYDADKNYLGFQNTKANTTFVTLENAHFMRFLYSGTTYNNDICISLHWDGERDGEYEPYTAHEYALDPDLELRGIPKLDANNNLYYDGDTYESDGTVTRKWAELTNQSGAIGDTITLTGCDTSATDIITSVGHLADVGTLSGTTLTLTKAISGVTIQYPLATPTTETADSYQSPQIVDDWGTEEYVDTRTVPIPVGHVTQYPENLRKKIEDLPSSLSMIAPIENGTTASQGYSQGQYFLHNNQFCKAKTAISNGATFTLGTNYEVTTVAAELFAALS